MVEICVLRSLLSKPFCSFCVLCSTGLVVQFKNPPQHIEVRAGQTARLTCSFTGSAPVVSCWITNKEQVGCDSAACIYVHLYDPCPFKVFSDFFAEVNLIS